MKSNFFLGILASLFGMMVLTFADDEHKSHLRRVQEVVGINDTPSKDPGEKNSPDDSTRYNNLPFPRPGRPETQPSPSSSSSDNDGPFRFYDDNKDRRPYYWDRPYNYGPNRRPSGSPPKRPPPKKTGYYPGTWWWWSKRDGKYYWYPPHYPYHHRPYYHHYWDDSNDDD